MSRSDRPSGFTLVEVMAAVALLGILFTVLASVAIRGLRAEGESKRRIDASLIADRQMTDIETEFVHGIVPPTGRSEFEEGEFRIAVEVTPFEFPAELLEVAERGEEERDAVPSLLLPGGEAEAAVRTVEVTVSWFEGGDERSVVRTTYGLDLAAAEGLVLAAPQGLAGLTGEESLQ